MKHSYWLSASIVFLSSMFYVYEFFLRVMPSVITVELQHDFCASLGTVSIMTACFGYAYAFMQIPAGALIDHYGPRRVLTAAVLICATASFVFMSTHDMLSASISRLFIGAASACAFIAPLTLASRWFEARHFAMVAGIVQMLGCIGAIAGQKPIAVLTEQIGWRDAMFYAASIGLVLAIIFFAFIRDFPPGAQVTRKNKQAMGELERIKLVLCNKQTWYIGIAGFACWAPIGALAEFIGPRFFETKHQITTAESAGLFVWVWVMIGMFSPIVGWWSDRIGKRKQPLLILGAISFISSINVLYLPGTLDIDTFWLCLIGISAAAQPITFALVTDINPKHIIATAIGFNNMAVASGAFLTQPIIGSLMDLVWEGQIQDGIHAYGMNEFHSALIIIPLCSLIGMLITYFCIEETHCNQTENAAI